MNSWERVLKAMQLSIPDRIPLYETETSPKISSVILGKNEDEVMVHNPRAFYDMVMSVREIDLDKLNERIANEILTICGKLGLDWIRGIGAYDGIPREVEKIDELTWLINGKRYKWSGETMWNLDQPKTYDPDDVKRACKSSKVTVNQKTFDVLRRLVKEAKGKMFVSFDADGTWGPILWT